MAGDGKAVTNPMLDVDDFVGRSFTTGPDGKLYQLPDQQFANLYWFRKDWFDRPDLQKQFKSKYGYDLGVPVNWSAYEDIAEFFSVDVKEIDGVRVYGHMDYGKRAPDLGWRMTDAWLSMAGAGRKDCRTASRSTNGVFVWKKVPVTRLALRSRAVAPPMVLPRSTRFANGTSGCASMPLRALPATTSTSRCRHCQQGNVAQQIFWYTAFTASMVAPKAEATILSTTMAIRCGGWRPHRMDPTGKTGQKLGYQDAGSWTLFKSTPVDRRKAAWLYAQFVVSKTVDVKKSHVGLTFIRDTTINHDSFTERAPKLGGLVEFYRSPDRVLWSPTGVNVPDYPKLAQIWWQQIGDVNSGAFTPQQAMDRLAERNGPGHVTHAGGRRKGWHLRWLWTASERGAGCFLLAEQAWLTKSQGR